MFKKLIPASFAATALALSLVLFPHSVGVARADGEWCEAEPAILGADGQLADVTVMVNAPASHIVSNTNVFQEQGARIVAEPLGDFPQRNVLVPGGSPTRLNFRVIVVDPADHDAEVAVVVNGKTVATGVVNRQIDGSVGN